MASFVTFSALFTIFMVTSLTSASVMREEEPREFPPMDDSDIGELANYCSRGNLDGVIKMLDSFGLEQVGKLHGRPRRQETCLYKSADRSVDVVELLAKKIADLDTINGDEGETALRRAIRYRAYLSIATLIRYGASLEKAKQVKENMNENQNEYEESMAEEKTKAAIAFGQRMNALG